VSQIALYADLAARKLVSRDGGAVTLPSLVFGDRCLCPLSLLERAGEVDLREKQLNFRTLNASIGKTLEPPAGGAFTLRGQAQFPATYGRAKVTWLGTGGPAKVSVEVTKILKVVRGR
jgi:hypothetical protein